MRVSRRFVIRGRVQGVGFRYFAREAAGAAGVSGWVRNLPDGRVEAVAEGEAAAVDAFERQVRRGPGLARVETVDTADEPPAGALRGFEIRE